MRVRIGIAGILGFGLSITVALAQGPGQRGARLLAPHAADVNEAPVYARAAAEPLPQFPDSTPVTAPQGKNTSQSWLRGNDPYVRPASGGSGGNVERPMSRPPAQNVPPKDELPSFMTKSFEKIKNTFTSSTPTTGTTKNDPTNPNAPFRGTGPGGQPVYAGPPAYRWYGWGSVTPGANPYAPTGQFPRASANWYSITGATPGAFPTQVVDPYRLGTGTGTEPPMYVSPPAPATPPSTTHYSQPIMHRHNSATPPPVVPRASYVPAGTEQPRQMQSPESFIPPPTLTPIPSVGSTLPVMPVVPVAVPTLAAPPTPGTPQLTPLAVAETAPTGPRIGAGSPLILAPMVRSSEPQTTMPPVPTLPALPVVSTPPQPSDLEPQPVTAPASLPTSVTEELPKWQPSNAVPTRSDWNPARSNPQVRPVTP